MVNDVMAELSGGFGGDDPRDCLALAIDLHDLDDAVRLARSLVGYFRVVKVGVELYCASGPKAVGVLADLGYEVFCDLKFHDIPTTVNRAASVVGKLGVSYLTVHAAGGRDMLQAGVDGLVDGASSVGGEARVLAVTVLTSERAAPRDLQAQQIRMAADVGCGGVVCAATDLAVAAGVGGDLIHVVPGIRMPGDSNDDQRRIATPAGARADGADLLVIGRSVTRASNPVIAAQRIHRHLCG